MRANLAPNRSGRNFSWAFPRAPGSRGREPTRARGRALVLSRNCCARIRARRARRAPIPRPFSLGRGFWKGANFAAKFLRGQGRTAKRLRSLTQVREGHAFSAKSFTKNQAEYTKSKAELACPSQERLFPKNANSKLPTMRAGFILPETSGGPPPQQLASQSQPAGFLSKPIWGASQNATREGHTARGKGILPCRIAPKQEPKSKPGLTSSKPKAQLGNGTRQPNLQFLTKKAPTKPEPNLNRSEQERGFHKPKLPQQKSQPKPQLRKHAVLTARKLRLNRSISSTKKSARQAARTSSQGASSYSKSLKKSFPLSSTKMNAGKSLMVILRMASIPSSGNATMSFERMFFSARSAAGPPIEPR